MNISVSCRGQVYPLSVLPDSTIETLQSQLEELTDIQPPLQKLLFKGKKPSLSPETTLADAGIKDGMKVQLIGSTVSELDKMRSAEDEKRRRNAVLERRAKTKFAKVHHK